jgi:hypothetical protein
MPASSRARCISRALLMMHSPSLLRLRISEETLLCHCLISCSLVSPRDTSSPRAPGHDLLRDGDRVLYPCRVMPIVHPENDASAPFRPRKLRHSDPFWGHFAFFRTFF